MGQLWILLKAKFGGTSTCKSLFLSALDGPGDLPGPVSSSKADAAVIMEHDSLPLSVLIRLVRLVAKYIDPGIFGSNEKLGPRYDLITPAAKRKRIVQGI
jgi:hypothetical protein